MKRPSDTHIRYGKVLAWTLIILTGILAIWIQGLELKESIFWITLSDQGKSVVSYIIIALGVFPLVLWGLDIPLLSRGYTRIAQSLFGVLLICISWMFQETASLGAGILYFFIGLFILFAGISGKAVTKKGLRHGQKIQKIRV